MNSVKRTKKRKSSAFIIISVKNRRLFDDTA